MTGSRDIVPARFWGLAIGVALFELACGPRQAEPPREPLVVPATRPEPARPARPSIAPVSWWNRGPAACPKGAKPRGIVRSEVWCAKADGTRHGRYTYWSHRGYRYYDGFYEQGRATGQWTIWRQDGTRWRTRSYAQGVLVETAPLWPGGTAPPGCRRRPGDCDGDGVPDLLDLCPLDAEDKDGFHDADGCPEVDLDHACPVESRPCRFNGVLNIPDKKP
jgi:hypothetical protein